MVYTTTILCVSNQENSNFIEKYVKIESHTCGHNGLSQPLRIKS